MWQGVDFSGGGVDIYRSVGAACELQRHNPNVFDNVTHVSGASAGSVLATLFALTNKDMAVVRKEFLSFDFSLVFGDSFLEDEKLHSLYFNFGVNNCEKVLTTLIDPVLARYCDGNANVTFKELFKKTHIHLCVRSVDLIQGKTVHFNHETYPNKPIRSALWASCSVPWFSEPAIYERMYLIDGGVLANVEPHCFSPSPQNVLCIYIEKEWSELLGPFHKHLANASMGEVRGEAVLSTHLSVALSVMLVATVTLQRAVCDTIESASKICIKIDGHSNFVDTTDIDKRKHEMLANGENVVRFDRITEKTMQWLVLLCTISHCCTK